MLCWLFWLLIVAVALILTVAPLRRVVLTKWVLLWFKSVLPPMSSTEREAIEAGDTWHEANLFQGNPKWKELLANPKPQLSDVETKYLNDQVNTLCSMLDDWQITHKDLNLPENVWDYLKKCGILALHIPKRYGGLEFSALASSTIVQKISTKSLTAAVTVMVPNSLGPAELLLNYGTEQQRNQYLPRLAQGLEIPCFGLTSPVAGSDAGSITDEGIVTKAEFNGQKNVLGLRLNWNKRYITLAPVATLIGLAVKVKDPDHLLGQTVDLGITVVLLPADLPGIEIGKRHYPLNQAFMNGPIRGKNVFVPLDFVIGGKERIGHGWQMLVECLAAGRGISLPALGTATGKHCFRVSGAYAKLRQQFNLSIGKFEGVAEALARIGGFTYMLEATRLLTVGAIDRKHKPSVITAICKYHMTEMGRQIVNDAMDIHGGRGIILGPRNYLARMYEGIPISITVEGANILTRCLMIFGQGAIRCHPYVYKEMEAAINTDKEEGLRQFDKYFVKHVIYTAKNKLKLIWHSLTCTVFCQAPSKTMYKKYYRRLSYFSIALSYCADLSMLILGGNLKRKENLSARLGDVLSFLYIGSAVLKYAHDNGEPSEARPYVEWSLDYCLYRIQHSLEYFLVNFPLQIVGRPLLWLILPPWRKFRLPKDNLGLKISNHMLHPSSLRDRLTEHSYPIEKLEQAWLKMVELDHLLTKINQAQKDGTIPKGLSATDKIIQAQHTKVITAEEASALHEFEAMRLDILQVDEFTPAELLGH